MEAPAAQVRDVAVCPVQTCGASFVITDDQTRLATGADTETLTGAELDTLKKARKRTR